MKAIKGKMRLKTFLMLVSNVIAIIFMIILAISFYATTEGFISNRKQQIDLGNYNHIKLGIDNNINDIKNIAFSIINDNKLIEWIKENEDPAVNINRRGVIEENIQSSLSYNKASTELIKCIIINTFKNQYSSVPVFVLSSKIKETSLYESNNSTDILFLIKITRQEKVKVLNQLYKT